MIKRNEKDELIIAPCIFEKDEFEVDIEERLLKQASFESSKDFKETLMDTQPNLVSLKVVKS